MYNTKLICFLLIYNSDLTVDLIYKIKYNIIYIYTLYIIHIKRGLVVHFLIFFRLL